MVNGRWHRLDDLRKGFTLIEIILVIALIGVSASVVIALVNPVQQFKKANDAKRKADVTQLQAALELYRADQDFYPETTSIPQCGNPLTFGTTTYLRSIPCDPKTKGNYVYDSLPVGAPTTYSLIACLENTSDLSKDVNNDDRFCDGDTDWSYTVTNP